MPGELLPIKVLLPDASFDAREQPGGGARKIFVEPTTGIRRALIEQVSAVEDAYRDQFRARPDIPAVAKVRLRDDALAKSHRPDRLLSEETCPIIGVGELRELFVKVTPAGLGSLRERIRTDATREGRANISTVEELRPIDTNDRLDATDSTVAAIERAVEADGFLKIELFDYQDRYLNDIVLNDFRDHLRSIGSELRVTAEYTPELRIHVVTASGAQVRPIASHPAIRRASLMPKYYAIRHRALPVGVALPQLPDGPATDDSPVVGLIDAGVADSCGPLAPWILSREIYVPHAEQDREHGTFVGGLIAFGPDLNVGIAPAGGPCRLVDVIAIPRDDPAVSALDEAQLVAILHEVVPKYPTVKIWNLSLGSDVPCRDDAFSDLARALDALQRQHNVQFVLAAGNLDDPPLRTWRPQGDMGERDRICSPADSITAITVGSLAHARTVDSLVDISEPSPFSCRGPGPSYIVKPEVVHFGGNCDADGNYQQTGVRSVGLNGELVEGIGTSYAAPLVSGLMANVVNALDPAPSLNLAKALIVHAASQPPVMEETDLNYFGFGRPPGLAEVLHATQSSATLIFEDVIEPGYMKQLYPFPYPACLIRGGKSFGRVRMTLVYDPPLNASYGLEYCRANVSASLGTVRPDANGRMKYHRELPPDPERSHEAFEEELVKHGFKWCPTKSYRRDIARGINSEHWRLTVELLHRHDQDRQPQRFALLVTIEGDEGQPVYDDLVLALRGYNTQDLALKAGVRQRVAPRGTL